MSIEREGSHGGSAVREAMNGSAAQPPTALERAARAPQPRRARRARTMNAAVLVAPGRFALREVPRPDPGPGQVRVRLFGCGICASSLPVFEGRPWFRYPLEPGLPGHEAWGRVDAVGPGSRWREGDRLALLSERGFAQWAIVPDEEAAALPEAFDGEPFPGEAIGSALNVLRRSGVAAGQRAAVVGAGFLGLLLVQLLRSRGVRVFAVSRRRFARRLARRMGAEETAELAPEAAERIAAWTEGAGCARVFEVTGHQAGLDLAGSAVATRGRLVIAGFHQDGERRIDLQGWNWRGIDVVNAHERDTGTRARGMRLAVRAVLDGALDPSPLLTHAVPLEQIERGLALAAERPDGFVKGWVDCGGRH